MERVEVVRRGVAGTFTFSHSSDIVSHYNNVLVPKSLSSVFFKRLMKDVPEYYEDNGVFYTSCGTPMKDLFLMFQNYWI